MEPRDSDVIAHDADAEALVVSGLHEPERCRAASMVLARVEDKWSVLVVMVLGDGTLRFSELKRHIGSITQRMLTRTLRGLERDGLVTRTVYPTVPPRVEYELTPRGRSHQAPVTTSSAWSVENYEAIPFAREVYDAPVREV